MSSLSFCLSTQSGSELPGSGLGGRTQPSRENLAVDDKAGFFGKLVVQFHSGSIAFVGQPVDATGAGGAGLGVDRFNQRASHSFAALSIPGEQVLQITVGRNRSGAAMKQVMHQPQKLALALGDERVQRLVRVEES
jgi:hypothetical protein